MDGVTERAQEIFNLKIPGQQTQREKILWMQQNRMNGTWVKCFNCQKWRYLRNIFDPVDIPDKWQCSMNQDNKFNSCEEPQSQFNDSTIVKLKFTAGSLVWVNSTKYSRWPGMIDDDPEFAQFYWLGPRGQDRKACMYHVVFIDVDSKDTTRQWFYENELIAFTWYNSQVVPGKQSRLIESVRSAAEALDMNVFQRLQKFGFARLYRGHIYSFGHAMRSSAVSEGQELDYESDCTLLSCSDTEDEEYYESLKGGYPGFFTRKKNGVITPYEYFGRLKKKETALKTNSDSKKNNRIRRASSVGPSENDLKKRRSSSVGPNENILQKRVSFEHGSPRRTTITPKQKTPRKRASSVSPRKYPSRRKSLAVSSKETKRRGSTGYSERNDLKRTSSVMRDDDFNSRKKRSSSAARSVDSKSMNKGASSVFHDFYFNPRNRRALSVVPDIDTKSRNKRSSSVVCDIDSKSRNKKRSSSVARDIDTKSKNKRMSSSVARDIDNKSRTKRASSFDRDVDSKSRNQRASSDVRNVDYKSRNKRPSSTVHDVDYKSRNKRHSSDSHDVDSKSRNKRRSSDSHDVDSKSRNKRRSSDVHDIDTKSRKRRASSFDRDSYSKSRHKRASSVNRNIDSDSRKNRASSVSHGKHSENKSRERRASSVAPDDFIESERRNKTAHSGTHSDYGYNEPSSIKKRSPVPDHSERDRIKRKAALAAPDDYFKTQVSSKRPRSTSLKSNSDKTPRKSADSDGDYFNSNSRSRRACSIVDSYAENRRKTSSTTPSYNYESSSRSRNNSLRYANESLNSKDSNYESNSRSRKDSSIVASDFSANRRERRAASVIPFNYCEKNQRHKRASSVAPVKRAPSSKGRRASFIAPIDYNRCGSTPSKKKTTPPAPFSSSGYISKETPKSHLSELNYCDLTLRKKTTPSTSSSQSHHDQETQNFQGPGPSNFSKDTSFSNASSSNLAQRQYDFQQSSSLNPRSHSVPRERKKSTSSTTGNSSGRLLRSQTRNTEKNDDENNSNTNMNEDLRRMSNSLVIPNTPPTSSSTPMADRLPNNIPFYRHDVIMESHNSRPF